MCPVAGLRLFRLDGATPAIMKLCTAIKLKNIMKPLIYPIGHKTPIIHETAFIAPGVVICGDVEIGPEASIWYGSVLRGDTHKIIIGEQTNIQDGTIIHVDDPDIGGTPTVIGKQALIGHRCMLHGCTVEDGGFVGMGATMLDGSKVESGAMLAAGAFLSPKKVVKAGEMWAGLPAKKFRDLKDGESQRTIAGVMHYVHEAKVHMAALEKAQN